MKIGRLINVEIKHHDVLATTNLVDNAGTVQELCNVPQGQTRETRGGDSIKPQGLTIRGAITMTSPAINSFLRVMIVRGKHENGTPPTVASILDGTTGNFHYAPKDYDNRFHTKVLFDTTYALTSNGRSCANFKKNIKLRGHINWTSASTSEEDGGVYLVMVSSEGTNLPNFRYHSRLTYTDN